MMNYDNLITPEKARKAAQILNQFCNQCGCLYCPFAGRDTDEIYCTLEKKPRDYQLPYRDMNGGIHHA